MEFHVFGKRDNPKMILLHGVLTPWQIWNPQITYFREKYCIIVPALDGHEEEKASEFISIENEAKQVEEYCLNTFGCEIFAICGISMGGAIAHIL